MSCRLSTASELRHKLVFCAALAQVSKPTRKAEPNLNLGEQTLELDFRQKFWAIPVAGFFTGAAASIGNNAKPDVNPGALDPKVSSLWVLEECLINGKNISALVSTGCAVALADAVFALEQLVRSV